MTGHTISAHLVKTSPFRGVHWCADKKRWRAEIEVSSRRRKLGRHATEILAALAYDAAAIRAGVPERCNFGWNSEAAS